MADPNEHHLAAPGGVPGAVGAALNGDWEPLSDDDHYEMPDRNEESVNDEALAAVMKFYDMINEGSTRNGPDERFWYEYQTRRAIETLVVVGFRVVRIPPELILACPCCGDDGHLVGAPGPNEPIDEYVCGSCDCNFVEDGTITFVSDECMRAPATSTSSSEVTDG